MSMLKLPQANPPLNHPGPKLEPRVVAVTTAVRYFDIPLAAGSALNTAILEGFAKAGLDSGFVEFRDLDCAKLNYVIPAHSATPERLAWYSTPRAPEGAARINLGFMSVGRHQTSGFTHCHGSWTLADGTVAMGHLLSEETIVAQACVIHAAGFINAYFDRCPDPETCFNIFAAKGECNQNQIDAIVMTIRPNTDIATACAQICTEHKIQSARIVGLGSLNGALFADATQMRDYVSEFIIRQGLIQENNVALDIAVVDSKANQFQGEILTGGAEVSITSELVIIPN